MAVAELQSRAPCLCLWLPAAAAAAAAVSRHNISLTLVQQAHAASCISQLFLLNHDLLHTAPAAAAAAAAAALLRPCRREQWLFKSISTLGENLHFSALAAVAVELQPDVDLRCAEEIADCLAQDLQVRELYHAAPCYSPWALSVMLQHHVALLRCSIWDDAHILLRMG
jgi:hypothetical protein